MAWQQPQYTGYPQQQQGRPLYAQPTGYPGQQPQQLYAQPTGFYPGQQPSFGAPPPVPALPPAPRAPQPPPIPQLPPSAPHAYQQQPAYGGGGLYPQQTGYNPSYNSPQPTGYQQSQATGAYGMQPQGFQSAAPMQMPSLFTSVFMPANPSAPRGYEGGNAMQFSQPAALQGHSLQQTFQQANMQQLGHAELKVPWALSAEERKNYDQIFRAWDDNGSGFVSGAMAQQVFGQSGIARDDLMKIWNLADVENRGKLNLAEFHVAMGLIYRKINGNPIPDQLPPELVPPSQRDLGTSVDFVKDLLRKDNTQRATASPDRFPDVDRLSLEAGPDYRRNRSLHESQSAPSRKDAAVYRHDDSAEPKTYKPSSRHLDRRQVRYRGDDDGGSSDIDDMRRQLDQSQNELDRGRAKEAEADELKEEKDDMLHRIRQLQSDIQHNSSGRRTEQKEAERRRLDRELDDLKYHRLPELERKMEQHKREADQQRREAARRRDDRNNRSRFDEDEDRRRYRDDSSYSRGGDADRRNERGYMRGSYADESGRSSPRSDSRPRSRASSPPPKPSTKPQRAVPPRVPTSPQPQASPAPPPRAETPSTAAKSLSSMTPEERKEHIRAEAAKRVQTALAKFGVAGAPSNAIDPSVEQRLEQDRKEATERAQRADQEAAERERQRQVRLETERLKDLDGQQANLKKADAALKEMGDAVTVAANEPAKVSNGATEATRSEINKASDDLREQEEALLREKQARQDRLKRLQEEVEETRRQEEEAEEAFKRSKAVFSAKPAAPAAPPSRARGAPPAPPSSRKPPVAPPSKAAPGQAQAPVAAPQAPVAPPAPPIAPPQPIVREPSPASTNPFHKMQTASSGLAAPPGDASNPFRRPSSSGPAHTPAAPRPPSPPRPTEDWDVGSRKEDSGAESSDDDEAPATRRDRAGLASALFGNIMPPISRPSSAQASNTGTPVQSPVVSKSAGAPSAAPPPAPSAPRAHAPSAAASPLEPGAPRNALLSQIQGGASLRRTQVNDRSTPATAGRIIDDGSSSAPPSQSYSTSPAPISREAEPEVERPPRDNRMSVDWYGTMASDGLRESSNAHSPSVATPSIVEEEEVGGAPNNVDGSKNLRIRMLYAYSNPGEADHLAIDADLVVDAHPATDNNDWLYATHSGQSGWIPASYSAPLAAGTRARALYDYTPTSDAESPLAADKTYDIVDTSDADWWRLERGGRILLVPAAYMEIEGSGRGGNDTITKPVGEPLTEPIEADSDGDDDAFSSASEGEEEEDEAAVDREQQRARVLEAAGLLTQENSATRRRPPPPPRQRSSTISSVATTATTEAPRPASTTSISAPAQQPAVKQHADDAYDRYVRMQRDIASSGPSGPTSAPVVAEPSPAASPPSTPKPATANFLSWVSSGLARSTPSPSLSGHPTVTRVPSGRAPHVIAPSWASLIDPSALETIPDMERKRQEAIFELIQTESTYLSSLQQLVGTFFANLLPALSERTAEVLFSNVEQLLLNNVSFLSDLEERQRETRLFIDRIGDIVFSYAQNLDLFRTYCANQGNAMSVLNDLKENDAKVSIILQETRVNGLELEHFLLQPMQRLTRYPLLFNQIVKYSEAGSAEHDYLVKATEQAEAVLRATNEAIRRQESEAKLKHLTETLVFPGTSMGINLLAPSRTMGTRVLLKEGSFTRSRSSKRVSAYLLNDLLLLTHSSHEGEVIYKDPLPLEELSVREGRDNSVVIVHRGRKERLRASSPRQAMTWTRDLRGASDEVRKAIQASRGGL